jgi:hypothetical protein
MSNLLMVFGWVLLGLAVLAACGLPAMFAIFTAVNWRIDNETERFPVRRVTLLTAAFIAALTLSIWVLGSLIPTSDGSEHCGPGTHYLQTGSGKYRSWICVAS